jgi:murein DD-endopeptidase MepM/ murein hydrolase activator NlpD
MNAYPRSHLKAAVALTALLAIVITGLPAYQQSGLPEMPVSLEVVSNDATPDFPLDLAADRPISDEPESLTVATSRWVHMKVKSGDNLAKIFKKIDLPAADLQEIIDIGKDVSSLRKILPNQELSFQLSATGDLMTVKYKKNAFDSLLIDRNETGFAAHWESATPETAIVFETATISRDHPSLYHAGKATGLSDNVIMKLSYIFQWDISFALDLRAGDSFSLMFEEIYVNGEKVKEGDIIAATFTNMGKVHEAVRYTGINGKSAFYTPEGLSMRKAFLRDPVHFSHVSSSFNLRRLHPIHKKVMPHRGIDYAANKGTPVVASGDGKVTTRRSNNASGRYVVIQHGEQYTTKYLHLSGFAAGIKPGKAVKQGQTIGYVGATGWATAPHLHYEFLVNGVHRNPKTVSLPKASPIAKDELIRFSTVISPVLAQLESASGKHYAAISYGDRTSGGE